MSIARALSASISLMSMTQCVGNFGDRQGLVMPLSDAASYRFLYICGYKFNDFALALLGGRLAPTGRQPTARDIAFNGLGGANDCPANFPGTMVHVNGEAARSGPKLARPTALVYYLGPLAHPIPGALQVYYAAEAYQRIDPFQRTVQGMQRQKNTRRYGLLYAASHCVPARQQAFDMLSKVVQSFAAGSCHGSHPELYKALAAGRAQYRQNYLALRDYRFVLAMENARSPGYITEKILYAFAAGAVPIYHGTHEVFDLFNHEAFIYYDPDRPQAALDAVAYLERNRTAYAEMVHKPVFAYGAQIAYFAEGLKRRVETMLAGGTEGPPVCSLAPKNAHRWSVFKQVVAALHALNCPFTIHDGTLLNFVRDCELLDSDFDFTIPLSWWRVHGQALELEMKRRGFKHTYTGGAFGEPGQFGYEVAWSKGGIKTDLFSRIDQDDAIVTGLWVDNRVAHCYTKRSYTATTTWAGMSVRVPMPVDAALVSSYGPNWKQPYKGWNWRETPFTIGSCRWSTT